jgi:hypothetical protein
MNPSYVVKEKFARRIGKTSEEFYIFLGIALSTGSFGNNLKSRPARRVNLTLIANNLIGQVWFSKC